MKQIWNALNSFHQNNTKNGQERKSRTFEIITGEFSLFGRVRYGKEGSLALEISRSLGYGVNKTSWEFFNLEMTYFKTNVAENLLLFYNIC